MNVKGFELKQLSPVEWQLPHMQGMRVPASIIGTQRIVEAMDHQVFLQIRNVATLPGVVERVFAMPDGHSGYGFPIGGVAAMDPAEGGVISPGGIGYDINCGMRLVKTDLTFKDVQPWLHALVRALEKAVPSGVASSHATGVKESLFEDVLRSGAMAVVAEGFGRMTDLEATELRGGYPDADTTKVSKRARTRGINQLGTLGSGNHYLEIQRVLPENIHDSAVAKQWGLFEDQIVVMFHCGSRGFGHQVASDYLDKFAPIMGPKYGITLPDKELACVPFDSEDGQDYYEAMKCGVNYAFANRQLILHAIRGAFNQVLGRNVEMTQLWDIAHNRGSVEQWGGRKVVVHRKGATGAYPAGHALTPAQFQDTGSPVIIGGSMETGSWLLAGAESGKTFYSTAHGAGRVMSRSKAKKEFNGADLHKSMMERGILVMGASHDSLAEEAGAAYKDVDEVIESTHQAGISSKVVKLVPIGNVKG